MPETKYFLRAWDTQAKEMIYIDDLYWFEENGVHDFEGDGHLTTYELMWAVPEADIEGQQIFLNDILYLHVHLKTCKLPTIAAAYSRYPDCDKRGDNYTLVSYMKGGFTPIAWSGADGPEIEDYKIAGNRFENPELLSM